MSIHNFFKFNFLKKGIHLFALFFFITGFFIPVMHAQTVNGQDYAVVVDASSRTLDQSDIQRIKLTVKSGKFNNTTFDTTFKAPTANIKRDLVKGDVVLVSFVISNVDNKIQSIDITDFYRLPNLFWAPILFILIFLIIVIVKYKRKLYIFGALVIATGSSAAIVTIWHLNSIIVMIVLFAIVFAAVLYFIYRKFYIALLGLLIPLIIGIATTVLLFVILQLSQIQISFLGVISGFYSGDYTDFSEAFYAGTLLACLMGSVYISYQQILESVKIKISHEAITKRDLTVKSFKHTIKNFDQLLFPVISFLVAIMFAVFLYLERSVGIAAALNNDYFVSLSVIALNCLIIWVATVPLCALLCGMILGRMEQHKIVTDKTISIID